MKIEYLTAAFESEAFLKILNYNLFYEINLKSLLFNSEQEIMVKNISNESIEEIEGILHGFIVIDSISIQIDKKILDQEYTATPIQHQLIRHEGVEGIHLQYLKIKMINPIPPGQEFLIHLNIYMPVDVIKKSEPRYMWSFVINPQVSYAVEPHSGHYLRLLYAAPSAPFDIMIRYPEENHSCVPGRLKSSKKGDGFVIDHYKCIIPNIPAFSVAPYQKIIKDKRGFGIEFYIYPEQSLDEDLFDCLFDIVQLFYKHFGDNGTNIYKFAIVGAYNSTLGGGENKGNAIYFDAKLLNEYNSSIEYRSYVAGLCAHEIFHHWNLFFTYFSGDLSEWFGEGGANFIATWAVEKNLGKDMGIFARRFFINSYINNEGYNAKKPLLNVDKSGGDKENLALIYYYGALVWEQLRQKIGEQPLISGLGRFFSKYGYENTTYKKLVECLEEENPTNIKEYLEPWVKKVQKIDLSITHINSEEIGPVFVTEVGISFESESDLEIFTDIGYKTSEDGEMQVQPIAFTKKGLHTLSIKSDQKPIFIHVDPFYRVPQVNLDNSIWQSKIYSIILGEN